jgi:protein-S-isoprenylcysteine O-methyltransferase Ste14
MEAVIDYAALPRRSKVVKARGTIALLILAPFLVLAIGSPIASLPVWMEWPLSGGAWMAFVAGVGFRFWAAAYIGGRKGQTISTEGPYSVCRNPLYFGSFLMLTAFVLTVQSLTFAIGAIAASAVYLGMTISDEEHRLSCKFGPAYLAYCRTTPRFLPRPWLLQTPERVDVNVHAIARECRSALLYLWLPLAARLVVALRENSVFPSVFDLP